MKELPPNCNPNGVYSAKRACAELGICYKTFAKWRRKGMIMPLNPKNNHRPLYAGKAIIDCWYSMAKV